MLGREAFSALTCVVSGCVLAYAICLHYGNWPGPVLAYSAIIVGVGTALVVVRYGRLGPFNGEFGPPRVETDIRRRIAQEVERARRYNHDLTIMAVRPKPRITDERRHWIRSVDHVIHCRKDTVLLVLPETTRDGAIALLSRLDHQTSGSPPTALVGFRIDGSTTDELVSALLHVLRASTQPGHLVMRIPGNADI